MTKNSVPLVSVITVSIESRKIGTEGVVPLYFCDSMGNYDDEDVNDSRLYFFLSLILMKT